MKSKAIFHFLVVFVGSISFSALGQAAEPPAPSSKEKIEAIERNFMIPASPRPSAEKLIVYFRDPDPKVRHKAYMAGIIGTRFTTADQLFALKHAVESETDPNARVQAKNTWQAMRVSPYGVGVDSEALPGLEEIALSGDLKKRYKAIEILGAIQASAGNTYINLLKDKDTGIKLLTINAIREMFSNMQGSEASQAAPVGAALISSLMEDPAVREQAGLAVFHLAPGRFRPYRKTEEFLTKFDASNDLDERAIATVVRLHQHWSELNWDSFPRERVAQALRSRYRWVRAIASDSLFRTNAHINRSDARAILKAAVNDPNPDVAGDAASRLAGALSLYSVQLGYPETEEIPSKVAAMIQQIQPDPEGLESKDPKNRLTALRQLDQKKPVVIAVVLSTHLFADPDPDLAKAARQMALKLIEQSENSAK